MNVLQETFVTRNQKLIQYDENTFIESVDFEIAEISCYLQFNSPIAFPENPMEPLRGMLGWALGLYLHTKLFKDVLPLSRSHLTSKQLREILENRIPSHSPFWRLFKVGDNQRPPYNLTCPWNPGTVTGLPIVLRTFGPHALADAELLTVALCEHGHCGFRHRDTWYPYKLFVQQPAQTLPPPEIEAIQHSITIELMTPVLLDIRLDRPLPRIPLSVLFFPDQIQANRKLWSQFQAADASMDPSEWRFYHQAIHPLNILLYAMARSASDTLAGLMGHPRNPDLNERLRKAALEETILFSGNLMAYPCRIKQNEKGFGLMGQIQCQPNPLLRHWLQWAALLAVGECNIYGYGRVQVLQDAL